MTVPFFSFLKTALIDPFLHVARVSGFIPAFLTMVVQRRTSTSSSKKVTAKTEKLKDHSSRSLQMTSHMVLESFVAELRGRPVLLQHLYTVTMSGGFDSIDREVNVEDAEALPRSCNKFQLLSVPNILTLVTSLMPESKEWFLSLPGKPSKREALQVLCFMVHAAPDSALPTKSLGGLITWCKERWEKYGKRFGDKEQAPASNMNSLKTWMDHCCESYWDIDTASGSISYVTGEKFKLPEEIRTLGVDDCTIQNGLDVFNCTVGKGCLRIRCSQLADTKTLDLPYWRKEVPLAEAVTAMSIVSAGSSCSTSVPSSSPRSPATPATPVPAPPQAGSGAADLGRMDDE